MKELIIKLDVMPAQRDLAQNNSHINHEIDDKIDKTFPENYSTDCDYNNISSCHQNLPQVVNECAAEELLPTLEPHPTQSQSQTRLKSHRSGGPPRSSLISHHKMSFVVEGDHIDALPKEMSFTYFDAAAILFSIGSFLFDIGTDVAVAAFHYINNDSWYELNSKKTFEKTFEKTFDLKLMTFDEQVLRFDYGFRFIANSCNDRHFHEMVCSRL